MPAEIASLIRNKKSIADNIALDIRKKIEVGTYLVGSCLPGRRALAAEYCVASMIIQKAVSSLIADGLVRAENGRGTYVVRTSPLPKARLGTVGIVTYVYASWKGPGKRVEKATGIIQSLERTIAAEGGSSIYLNRYRQDGLHVPPSLAVKEVVEKGAESVVFVLDQDHDDFLYLGKKGSTSIPMVSILWDESFLPMPSVYYDSIDAGRSAAIHLLDHGCRHILFFSSGSATWSERRALGASEIIRYAGKGCEIDIRTKSSRMIPNALVELDYDVEAFEYAGKIFEDGIAFDGVIAANDRMAIQFAKVAAERGLHAGADYALIGFDNDDEARMAGLSTMQPPWHQMGHEAVNLLQGIMAGSENSESVWLRSHLIVRQSSKLGRRRAAGVGQEFAQA